MYQAKIDYTATQIDSVNSYKVNSSGELEAIDFEHYPGMKVVSQSFPEIKQNQLTTNQIKLFKLEVFVFTPPIIKTATAPIAVNCLFVNFSSDTPPKIILA